MKQLVKLSTNAEEDLKIQLAQWQEDGESGSQDRWSRMTLCERYRNGEHWDVEDVNYSEKKRRQLLTINRILPTVLQIVGFEVQNPRDITIKALNSRTVTAARVLSSLVKHALDENMHTGHCTRAFDDGVTTGRGIITVEKDFTYDPEKGDLLIESRDPFTVLIDPTCKRYDLNARVGGARYVALWDWEPKEKINAEYPKKVTELEDVAAGGSGESGGFFGRFKHLMTFLFGRGSTHQVQDDYRDTTNRDIDMETDDHSDDYRVMTWYFRKWVKGAYLKPADDPLRIEILRSKDEMAQGKAIAEAYPDQFTYIETDADGKQVVVPCLYRTKTVGEVILEHMEDPFDGMHDYPVVRFCPYFYHGYEMGVVYNLIGPQRQANWSWSMEVHYMRQLANSGWIIGADGGIEDILREQGDEDGIILDKSKAGNYIEKIKHNPFPMGMDILTTKGLQQIPEIASVRLEPDISKQDKGMSGRAILAKNSQANMGSELMMRNYSETLMILGRIIAGMIRTNNPYSQEEMMALLEETDLLDDELMQQARQQIINQVAQNLGGSIDPSLFEAPAPPYDAMMGNTEDLHDYEEASKLHDTLQRMIMQYAPAMAMQMLMEQLETLRYGRFTTKVALSPMAETMRNSIALQTWELSDALAKSGQMPLPREALIDVTDIPNKAKLKIAPQPQAAVAG